METIESEVNIEGVEPASKEVRDLNRDYLYEMEFKKRRNIEIEETKEMRR
jgi:hypothetical protein